MSCPYNVFYNNNTGRVIIQKNNSSVKRSKSPPRDFDKKIEELYKFTNINSPNNVSIDKLDNKLDNASINKLDNKSIDNLDNKYNNKIINDNDLEKKNTNNNNCTNLTKSLIYGIKKTILSDFNHLYQSSNTNDFKIGLNKNYTLNNKIFDCFYLFPNISEINTKNETNIINEKKIEIFTNNFNKEDIQYFPIDFVACGINIPLVNHSQYYTKIKIKNIFWNIFQSINSENYKLNEILCIVPNKDEYIFKNINLQVNFELHSQIISDQLPYKNNNIKSNIYFF